MVTRSRLAYTPEHQRLLRFLAVGASGTLLDFALLLVLRSAGMTLLPANMLSFSAGIANNYVLNRWWTYADARSKPIRTQLMQFVLVSLIGLAINTLAVVALGDRLSDVLHGASWSFMLAKLVATALSVGWNYIGNRKWTFNDARSSV